MTRPHVCVIYNHPHPETVDIVRDWNSQFGDVTIVAPPGGGGDVEYYTGSYLFQAALVEFLKARAPSAGYTIVCGDDMVLNPTFDIEALKQFPDSDQFLFGGDGLLPEEESCSVRVDPTTPRRLDEAPHWFWSNHVAIAMIDPMSRETGSGDMNPTDLLRGSDIWRAHNARISEMPITRWVPDAQFRPRWVQLLMNRLAGESGYVTIDVPLFFGYSDFFVFSNADAGMIADFLARTVRAKLFVEVAIPTMVAWSGRSTTLLHGRLDIRWGESRREFEFNDLDEVRRYFEEHPECVGIHPVKWSRMVGRL